MSECSVRVVHGDKRCCSGQHVRSEQRLDGPLGYQTIRAEYGEADGRCMVSCGAALISRCCSAAQRGYLSDWPRCYEGHEEWLYSATVPEQGRAA